jgi:hypothetical protein
MDEVQKSSDSECVHHHQDPLESIRVKNGICRYYKAGNTEHRKLLIRGRFDKRILIILRAITEDIAYIVKKGKSISVIGHGGPQS